MKRSLLHLAPLLLAGLTSACGGNPPMPASAPSAPAPTATVTPAPAPQAMTSEAPVGDRVSLREVGLDAESIDKTADPCNDFYAYACGNWIKNAQIPGDQPEWSHWSELANRNRDALRDILENAVKNPGDDPVAQKIGAFYGACMDEAAVEKAGRTPIEPYLKLVKGVKDVKTLGEVDTKLAVDTLDSLFGFGSQQDLREADREIAVVDQGGLGLPERDYYLRDDAESKALREKYVAHIEVMLGLSGYSKAEAHAGAADVMALETRLAKVAFSAVDRRDPEKQYHVMTVAELTKLAPNFAWEAYFKKVGVVGLKNLNVTNPPYFAELSAMMKSEKPAAWRAFLVWNIARGTAPSLSKAFVDANFDFFTHTLEGQPEQRPRWKRCIAATDASLGELLAQPWVKRMFSPEAKARAEKLVLAISDAFAGNIANLDWMDDTTRAEAATKRKAMVFQIGYPQKWRSYEFAISPHDYAKNVIAAARFEQDRQVAKIGKPVDRDEWLDTAPTVNAYYQPHTNEMVFPDGILQPPFFSEKSSDAANFGAIGLFAGHELTHGFDNNGAKFDGAGNLHNWWSPQVLAKFQAKGECLANQYSAYTVANGIHVNGQLTEGENIADGGGIKLAFAAFHKTRAGARPAIADGYTEDQQFFLAYGQAWCEKMTDQFADLLAQSDEHSPAKYRVNGVLSNLPAFSEAFQCKAGTPMHPVNSCPVW